MRLIDADILKEYFLKDAGPHPTELMWGYWAIETGIDSCPTVDAEPVKHGHWVQRLTGNEYMVFCSKCRTETTEIVDYELEYSYCPICGAKMDEVTP